MESKFSPDLTGQVPPEICDVCAKGWTLGHESGARAAWCEHSRTGFFHLGSGKWKRSRANNFGQLVIAFELAIQTREEIAIDQSRRETKQ